MAERVKMLWQAGKTGSEIADALDISRSAVLGHVHRLRTAGVPLAARGERKTSPCWFLKPKTAPARVNHDAKIIEFWGAGLTPKNIADKLGVKISYIRYRVAELRKAGHDLRRLRHTREDYNLTIDCAVQSRLRKKRERAAKTGNADASAAARFAAKIDAMPCFNTVLADTKPIALIGLASVGSSRGTCHWPLRVEGKPLFCGAAIDGTSPYCAGHHALAYRGAAARKAVAA